MLQAGKREPNVASIGSVQDALETSLIDLTAEIDGLVYELDVREAITSNTAQKLLARKFFVNEANVGGEFGDYTLVNASFDHETCWGNISLQLHNLLDEYYEYVFDLGAAGTDLIHSPGDGLNASVSVGIKF
jgi:hypothetical protein